MKDLAAHTNPDHAISRAAPAMTDVTILYVSFAAVGSQT
jgi:hypothetical protein